ncbi:hypothetical protein JI721_12365 [Alicyclobacillus cycloheptanicus]|uniref:Uncharacterized protein n=1 Tax=Alicyclobacillus cycloheptanicus TaxID=1457 RepID=A0ABT9XEZ9_9BACL|nr:hypothetical protein [Alicyclobacillus cycloheptanicus]MDQ0188850.1 hypothetical protein [Alicyclobacillus cycloheptanicus]WDM00504.1 hypothetical protein JI721_12365 [Alicyclobacillus cycloheptanicus]
MNDERPTSIRSTTQQALNEIIEEVVDTVATFDGRFSYTHVSADGHCSLSFLLGNREYVAALSGTAGQEAESDVRLSCSWRTWEGSEEDEVVIYLGPFNKAVIRYKLGAALADWYSRLIRSPHDTH